SPGSGCPSPSTRTQIRCTGCAKPAGKPESTAAPRTKGSIPAPCSSSVSKYVMILSAAEALSSSAPSRCRSSFTPIALSRRHGRALPRSRRTARLRAAREPEPAIHPRAQHRRRTPRESRVGEGLEAVEASRPHVQLGLAASRPQLVRVLDGLVAEHLGAPDLDECRR